MKRAQSRSLAPLTPAVLLFSIACEPGRPLSPEPGLPEPKTAASGSIASFQLTDYYPPAEAAGGWRKATDPAQILGLGIDPSRLAGLGSYLMALPHENYAVGVTGYDPTNKAAIVIKNGWIVGEYYNKASAATGVYYLASNGKTFAILLTGRMARDQAQLGLTGHSKLYDQRWLPQGFPLTDARKADITLDQVFRHASGIIPEIEQSIASGAVQPGTKWNFDLFTVGRDADYPATRPLYYTPGNPGGYAKGSAYSSVAFNHLSLIFRNVTGLEPGEYLRQAILQPIGVGRMAYKTTVGMGDYRWAAAGNGLASARDFARVGYLMLHEGEWNGGEILPAAWLRQFTTAPHYRNIRSNVDCRWGAKFPADMYRTTGSGQNWLLVVPSLDLVLSFNGRTPASQSAAVDTMSLKRLFEAVTQRYVACDGSVINDTPPPEPDNEPPSADFSVSCSGLDCAFGDGSADTDGTLASWSWSFGDGATSTEQSPSHSYAEAGSYTVTLTVTDDDGGTGGRSRTVAAGTGNAPPAADFESSCSGLSCGFTDRSADSDGSVQGWSWEFGDGATSSEADPSHQYAAGGTYQVTLTVTDDGEATHQTTAAVAVAAPAIALSATGREDATKQYMVLRWSGAVGGKVDIYRDNVRVNTTDNDGRHTINRVFTGPATYDMKLCQAKSTFCSNVVQLVFD